MRFVVLTLLVLLGCSHAAYKVGMHREDVYDRVDNTELEPFVSELRLGARHDLVLVPQGGFRRPHDERILSGERGSFFSRFRPTETNSALYQQWVESFAAVRLWHAIIFEDLRVVAVIDDERHNRLIDRVGEWMFERQPDFDLSLLDPIRVRLP